MEAQWGETLHTAAYHHHPRNSYYTNHSMRVDHGVAWHDVSAIHPVSLGPDLFQKIVRLKLAAVWEDSNFMSRFCGWVPLVQGIFTINII